MHKTGSNLITYRCLRTGRTEIEPHLVVAFLTDVLVRGWKAFQLQSAAIAVSRT